MKNTILAVFLLATSVSFAGGLEKGYEALAIKDYFKAHKYFTKSMFKNPSGAALGLSIVFAEEKNVYFDIDSALKYVVYADSAFISASQREKGALYALNITRHKIQEHKLLIADVAYEGIKDNEEQAYFDRYLKKFPFSGKYSLALGKRDSLAFVEAMEVDTYKSYRKFIIDYPGAIQKAKADSLYSLKFFEEKTAEGDVDTYKNFLNEFSSNPHADAAYEAVFEEVRKVDEVDKYYDHIRSYPRSPFVNDAWSRINKLYLADYRQESIANLLWDFPENPYKSDIEQELRVIFAPRFLISDSTGKQLIDNKGLKITKQKYDMISEYEEGMAVVSIGAKSGFINKRGDEVVPIIYDDAFPFHNGFSVVEKDGKFGAIDRSGEVAIAFDYEELGNFNDGMIPASKSGGFVYLDRFVNIAIDEIFEDASDFKGGAAVVKLNGAYGLINEKGDFLIPAEYEWVEYLDNGSARVKRNGKLGLWKRPDGLVLDCAYDLISESNEGMRTVVQGDKLGFVDDQGELLTELEFDYTPELFKESIFSSGHAKISKYGAFGIINKLGEFVVEPKYVDIGKVVGNITWYKEANRYGFLDVNGVMLDAEFESAEDFIQGVSVVGVDGKLGLINSKREFLIEPTFDELRPVVDTEFLVFKKDSLTGVIKRDGTIQVEGDFDSIDILKLRYAKMRKGDKVQYYDLDEQKDIYVNR